MTLDGSEDKMFIDHNQLQKDYKFMIEQVEQRANEQDEAKMQKLIIK